MQGSIVEEIKDFLTTTKIKQSALAEEAGVHRETISMLLNGKRRNVLGETQDKLRAAMARLRRKAKAFAR